MKRILKFFTAAAAVFSLIAALAAVSSADARNGVFVSETELRPGDEFTVTLVVPPSEDADTASVRLRYDETVFEGQGDILPEISGGVSNTANGIIALSAANAERAIKLGDGLTLTAKMKVRDDAPAGTYDFTFSESSFCYFDEETFDFVELWFPETLTAAVTVDSPFASVNAADDDAPSVQTEKPAETTFAPSDAGKLPSSDSTFTIIVIVIIAVVAAAVIITLIVLVRPRKNGK